MIQSTWSVQRQPMILLKKKPKNEIVKKRDQIEI